MGDGDAGYPGPDDGDIDLDVALQGGNSSTSAVANQRERLASDASMRWISPTRRLGTPALPGGVRGLALRMYGNGDVHLRKGDLMATHETERRNAGGGIGIGLGGILVIAGVVIALVWSVLLGVIVAVIGLVAFGGFAKGKWY
jgi:hypothetical protein